MKIIMIWAFISTAGVFAGCLQGEGDLGENCQAIGCDGGSHIPKEEKPPEACLTVSCSPYSGTLNVLAFDQVGSRVPGVNFTTKAAEDNSFFVKIYRGIMKISGTMEVGKSFYVEAEADGDTLTQEILINEEDAYIVSNGCGEACINFHKEVNMKFESITCPQEGYICQTALYTITLFDEQGSQIETSDAVVTYTRGLMPNVHQVDCSTGNCVVYGTSETDSSSASSLHIRVQASGWKPVELIGRQLSEAASVVEGALVSDDPCCLPPERYVLPIVLEPTDS